MGEAHVDPRCFPGDTGRVLPGRWPCRVRCDATPLDPIEAVASAFDTHQVVALGEGNHGNLPGHAFRLALIRDPRFQGKVRDIVVEFGNARWQTVMDRYVSGGEVDPAELKKVWQDTAQANPVWDVPIYEEFFRAVRDANAALPEDKQLRVILGDVPFDWSAVRTVEDYNRQPQRSDIASAAIIRREVIDKGRKALLVFGDMHFLRRPVTMATAGGTGSPGERSIVSILEDEGIAVFSIYTNSFFSMATVQPGVAQWASPALALLRGMPLGATPLVSYQPVTFIVDGRPSTIDPALSPRMEDEFDAVLYIGAPSTIRMALPSPTLCNDADYLAMRFFRMNLVSMAAQVEQARQYCAAVGGAGPSG